MKTITIYKRTRANGGVSVSTVRPLRGEFTEVYRLVADEGKLVTNGKITAACIDVESVRGWYEIDDSQGK